MDNSVENRAETEHHQEKTKKKKLDNSIDPPQPHSLPSPSSSPSHDFSFTISLHSSIPNTAAGLPVPSPSSAASSDRNSAVKTPNNSFAIDLSPADDIFFHGHLLPLHFLSHLPPSAASPRSSTNSLDSFTLPIKDLVFDDSKNRTPPNVPEQRHELEAIRQSSPRPIASSKSDSKIARKSKSFNLFGMPRWRKAVTEVRPRSNNTTAIPNNGSTCNNNSSKKKSKKNLLLDDASQLLKRYIRMMKPLLFSKRNVPGTDSRVNRDIDPGIQFDRHHHQNSSFSGNLSARRTNKNDFFHVRNCSRATSDLFSSAPASIRTSPTNSGLLVPSPTSTIRSNDSSTMEELQAAIQAAITHCKNSIAAAEEGKAVKA